LLLHMCSEFQKTERWISSVIIRFNEQNVQVSAAAPFPPAANSFGIDI
jgi:hypothetical protein